MNAQVVCHVRAGVTLTFKLKEKDAVVGRDPQNSIAVPVDGVSRHHAKILWDGKAYWVEDLRSTNGTFLNGQTAMRERLKHLDVISLGRDVDLVFLSRAAETAAVRQGIVGAALVAEGEGGATIAIAAGEATLGRAPSNNIVAESTAVSKVHARIERTLDQVILEDLGSANGTYVNGARVMTAFLQDGDILSLAGKATYRVVVEMGEVKGFSSSARMKAPVTPGERHRFDNDWKTRFDWDSGELKQLDELRQQIREREKLRENQRGKTNKVDVVKAPGHPARPATPAKASPANPSAPAKAAVPPSATEPTPASPGVAARPAVAPKPEVAAKPAAAAKPEIAARPGVAAKPAAVVAAPAGGAPAKPAAASPASAMPDTSKPAPPAPAPVRPPTSTAPAGPPAQPAPRVSAVSPVTPPAPAAAATPQSSRPAPAAKPPVAPAPRPEPTETLSRSRAEPQPQPTVIAPAAVPEKAAPISGPRPGAILEIRLAAEGHNLAVSEPGAHVLGRSADAPLRVNHPTVSRKHARIILADDRGIAYLQDAGGANGTRLNGNAVDKLAPLSDGDRVGIGEVELKVTLKRA